MSAGGMTLGRYHRLVGSIATRDIDGSEYHNSGKCSSLNLALILAYPISVSPISTRVTVSPGVDLSRLVSYVTPENRTLGGLYPSLSNEEKYLATLETDCLCRTQRGSVAAPIVQ